jgi:hypothetical protein
VVTDKELYASTIAGLMDYFGAIHLARMLNVSVNDLDRWAAGKARPPTEIFFRIINMAN